MDSYFGDGADNNNINWGIVYRCDDATLNVNSTQEGTFSSGSTIDVNITDGTDPVTPDAVIVTGNTVEIQVPAAATPVGATLMKTGQTISYASTDDGDIEAGRATNFTTLSTNNPFGNTNRFTDELGGQTYTNNIVIDWSTYDGSSVLGWYRLVNGGLTTWNQAIDGAAALSIGSYTSGWRCPNTTEILSICQWWMPVCLNYAPFNLNFSTYDHIWTSTTWEQSTVFARAISSAQLTYLQKVNSNNYRFIGCRTFTVTGTTLS